MVIRPRRYFRALCVVTLAALASGAAAGELPDDFGTYQFEDGACVSGGRIDEAGTGNLLFMDVMGNRRGGLFKDDGTHFESLIGPAHKLVFDANRDTMSWIEGDKKTTARLIHAPRQEGVTFASDGVSLAGTLYLPREPSVTPYPGIVLSHGSGQQTRYAATWAAFFVDHGFAVLAYDKRGTGESGGDYKAINFAELEHDLAAGVRWLAAHPEVDGKRVGIHATSQAGWYAPAVAGEAPVAFLVARVGPPLPVGPTTLHEQTEEWRAAGLSADEIDQAAALWRALMDAAEHGRSRAEAQALMDAQRPAPWFAKAYEGWNEVSPAWWRQQQVDTRYDPVADLQRHPVPTLWFLAERDENVPYTASVAALHGADLPKNMLTVVSVANAPHSFLITEADGSIHYTNDYWPRLSAWLQARGFTGPATPAARCR